MMKIPEKHTHLLRLFHVFNGFLQSHMYLKNWSNSYINLHSHFSTYAMLKYLINEGIYDPNLYQIFNRK